MIYSAAILNLVLEFEACDQPRVFFKGILFIVAFITFLAFFTCLLNSLQKYTDGKINCAEKSNIASIPKDYT